MVSKDGCGTRGPGAHPKGANVQSQFCGASGPGESERRYATKGPAGAWRGLGEEGEGPR